MNETCNIVTALTKICFLCMKYTMYPWSLQANLFMGGQCTFAIDLSSCLGYCATHQRHSTTNLGHCATHLGYCATNLGYCVIHFRQCATHLGPCTTHLRHCAIGSAFRVPKALSVRAPVCWSTYLLEYYWLEHWRNKKQTMCILKGPCFAQA